MISVTCQTNFYVFRDSVLLFKDCAQQRYPHLGQTSVSCNHASHDKAPYLEIENANKLRPQLLHLTQELANTNDKNIIAVEIARMGGTGTPDASDSQTAQ